MAAVMVGAASAGAHAQIQLTPVEQRVGDVSMLGTSQRVQPVDLRLPLGFDTVFRVRGAQNVGAANEGGYFARKHAGITAVFSQSVYVNTPWGVYPEVPPGTVFLLGVPDEQLGTFVPELRGAPTPERSPFFADLSSLGEMRAIDAPGPLAANYAAPLERVGTREPEARVRVFEQSIWGSDQYRQRRVGQLLDWAAAQ